MSAITIGGIFLILGAYYVYKGNIFYSTINYVLADGCWMYNALERDDKIGVILVGLGILSGLIVTNKMRIGEFRKTIRKDDE